MDSKRQKTQTQQQMLLAFAQEGRSESPMARAEGADLPSHDGTNSRKTRADKAQEIPLRREGSMLEITNVVDFLASDAASFLNGIDITVDGGHRAAWRGQGVISR